MGAVLPRRRELAVAEVETDVDVFAVPVLVGLSVVDVEGSGGLALPI